MNIIVEAQSIFKIQKPDANHVGGSRCIGYILNLISRNNHSLLSVDVDTNKGKSFSRCTGSKRIVNDGVIKVRSTCQVSKHGQSVLCFSEKVVLECVVIVLIITSSY